MTSLLDKLNLRPHERRVVVGVALIVFVALNIWLVWPQFGKVAFWENRRDRALKDLKKFTDEVQKKNAYEKQLIELQSQGAYVGTEEQALTLQRDVANQASLSGVLVNNYNSAPSAGLRTNAFFDEQTLIITVTTGEKELVDFLYNLGARSSLIRVKSMSLSPDPTRMKLQGNITLVASFAKKPPPKVATPPKTTNQPAKPAPAPSRTTNAPGKPLETRRAPTTRT